MNQKIPEYLNEKGNIVRLILYTALFALLFINIYQPFGSQNWFPVSDLVFFAFSSLVILTGVLVVILSRIIMYHYAKRKGLFVWQYALWVLAEIIAMASFYSFFEKLALDDIRPVRVLLRQSFINTSLVLLLPYLTIWLYFAMKDKNKKLEILRLGVENPDQKGRQMFNFLDEKKELKLSVLSEQVLWIESADNYVKIHYQNKGKIASFMVRNTLSAIENDFVHTSLVRCNRSTIINFDKVKILRRQQQGIFLSLDQESVPDIPVSRTYADRVMKRFTGFSV